ncbi:MAG: hypothetical protein LUI87_09925 [Lachnospiraceae bacterium]|nr:hypothetical protein [Lachnospiraceae bacterium]
MKIAVMEMAAPGRTSVLQDEKKVPQRGECAIREEKKEPQRGKYNRKGIFIRKIIAGNTRRVRRDKGCLDNIGIWLRQSPKYSGRRRKGKIRIEKSLRECRRVMRRPRSEEAF